MKPPKITLSASEIQTVSQDPLDLFYSGIKAAETRRTMNGNLKRFLVDACADILHGQRFPSYRLLLSLQWNEEKE